MGVHVVRRMEKEIWWHLLVDTLAIEEICTEVTTDTAVALEFMDVDAALHLELEELYSDLEWWNHGLHITHGPPNQNQRLAPPFFCSDYSF